MLKDRHIVLGVTGGIAAYKYHYIIIHQDWSVEPNALEIAAEQVYAIITARRRELQSNRAFLDELNQSLNA